MKIAVEGCAHGKLEKIYDTIEFIQQQNGLKIDLLLCCGDFQATRNVQDLQSMAVPKKYMEMGSFYKYYSGEKTAPVLTLFIGGNHEASNHLQELPYGGWVAPNIYYLGYAGVVNVGGLRIAGISGIFKSHDYMKGRYEKPPYDEKTKRSVYHTRNLDVFRLKQLKEPVDIFISHDWPRGIYKYGNANHLLRMKPFFLCQMTHDELGSPPCEEILFNLKPSYWFSAHLHCKFAALVPHNEEKEIKKTKFLALDKCLPNRKFLQVIDIPIDSEKDLDLEYDVEWLSVLHFTNHLINMKPSNNYLPGPGGSERWNFTPTDIEKEFILKKLSGSLKVPQNFCQTATVHVDKSTPRIKFDDPKPSPQTTTFCEKIGNNINNCFIKSLI
ncbi:hypothetical protein AAG570_013385 [Ranatra chinensis]|uniref:Lariat debranching enzyme C-terminal domain-containing protein n=1 Tax=Ranatra chinensis TaxID=642074 RepID=A0ABD0YC09_9HEMI